MWRILNKLALPCATCRQVAQQQCDLPENDVIISIKRYEDYEYSGYIALLIYCYVGRSHC